MAGARRWRHSAARSPAPPPSPPSPPRPARPFPRLPGPFRRAPPRIELTLLEDQTDALLAALAAGQLHAALIGQGRYDRPPPSLEVLLVAREPVVVAVHPAHPLAGR